MIDTAVILAGGLGTRLSEETHLKPKPMVEIGDRPIIWHIMKYISSFGISKFIICCGYKGHVIKDYFSNFSFHTSDVIVDLSRKLVSFSDESNEDWIVHLIDTGLSTETGGRLKRVRHLLNPSKPFLFTYGDGLCDVNLSDLYLSHINSNTLATVTAVAPPGRYGSLKVEPTSGLVEGFLEKPRGDGGLINGGYFILDPAVFDYIKDDSVSWEHLPLQNLASDGLLSYFHHDGFWQAMDTLRDKRNLESLWLNNSAPWKVW